MACARADDSNHDCKAAIDMFFDQLNKYKKQQRNQDLFGIKTDQDAGMAKCAELMVALSPLLHKKNDDDFDGEKYARRRMADLIGDPGFSSQKKREGDVNLLFGDVCQAHALGISIRPRLRKVLEQALDAYTQSKEAPISHIGRFEVLCKMGKKDAAIEAARSALDTLFRPLLAKIQ